MLRLCTLAWRVVYIEAAEAAERNLWGLAPIKFTTKIILCFFPGVNAVLNLGPTYPPALFPQLHCKACIYTAPGCSIVIPPCGGIDIVA